MAINSNLQTNQYGYKSLATFTGHSQSVTAKKEQIAR